MISLSLGQILIGILLIALIVLVIFLIVLVSNATDTIKKANAILDGGTEAVSTAITKIEEASAAAKAEAEREHQQYCDCLFHSHQILSSIRRSEMYNVSSMFSPSGSPGKWRRWYSACHC